MKEEIFRKKSLDRVKSPENLDDYIRVSSPSIWVFLISIIILLVGVCVWSIFGYVNSYVSTFVSVNNNKLVGFVSADDKDAIKVGMTVEYAGKEAVITKLDGNYEKSYEYELEGTSLPEDGLYKGKIIIRSYKPISFVMN